MPAAEGALRNPNRVPIKSVVRRGNAAADVPALERGPSLLPLVGGPRSAVLGAVVDLFTVFEHDPLAPLAACDPVTGPHVGIVVDVDRSAAVRAFDDRHHALPMADPVPAPHCGDG